MKLIHGDCLDELKRMKDNSVDSIVTDPPYGISFMNKKWDYDVPSVEVWTECLRVLKPGGHLLSFSGSRTYHRMAVRIEDAGFEIRDQIMWIYGSGFPKSLNIGKAVDKLQGNEREVVGTKRSGIAEGPFGSPDESKKHIPETKGQSEWEGWGTALKPAHEPIVLARKPLSEKTIVENVLKWGTGGINIDESRIGTDGGTKRSHQGNEWPLNENGTQNRNEIAFDKTGHNVVELNEGRWPANIMFDEEAAEILDEQSGISKSTKSNRGEVEIFKLEDRETKWVGKTTERGHNDKGGASRFFYCPKASKKDRDEGLDMMEEKHNKTWNERLYTYPDGTDRPEYKLKNNHPTVKPTQLMLYLIKLVTPKGGVVLDPFMGSGSTGKACVRGGYNFIGIEREEEYINISKARIEHERN